MSKALNTMLSLGLLDQQAHTTDRIIKLSRMQVSYIILNYNPKRGVYSDESCT